MKGRIFAGLFLCSLFLAVGGDAQSPDHPFSGYMRADSEKPVWALEFIKVQPENFALAMQYLHDHWMRVRAEAKQQGAVLDYHLISNEGIETPGHNAWDQGSIVLMTKYKNMDAYLESRSAAYQNGPLIYLNPDAPDLVPRGGVRRSLDDAFETLNTQVFIEEPDAGTRFKLLTKQ